MNLSPQAQAALARIARASGVRAEPLTLMPAEIVLELSGEAVRSRLCTFVDASGREHCLRPDLTTPIAQMVASGELPVARYHEAGPVYRLPPRGSNEPVEHLQVGFEWFGNVSSTEEDAEAAAVALEAAQAGGVVRAQLRFGDVALFQQLVAALPFSPQWRDRLRRAFARRKGPRELLEAAQGRSDSVDAVARIGGLPHAEAVAAVVEEMSRLGVEPVARTAEEIARRLIEKAADRPPGPFESGVVARYLSLSAPAAKSVEAVSDLARDAGIDLAAALDAYNDRLRRIDRLRPPFWDGAVFGAEAGRRFEYYDGFVFELSPPGGPGRPIVSGGRYDGLVARLSGGARTATAIGAALRADRLGGGGAP